VLNNERQMMSETDVSDCGEKEREKANTDMSDSEATALCRLVNKLFLIRKHTFVPALHSVFRFKPCTSLFCTRQQPQKAEDRASERGCKSYCINSRDIAIRESGALAACQTEEMAAFKQHIHRAPI
jgi:hypothetical protein